MTSYWTLSSFIIHPSETPRSPPLSKQDFIDIQAALAVPQSRNDHLNV